jgi:NADH:ubiquinone oxidoreductase subunit E
MCDQGPAMLVNDDIHTHVTPEKVADIIESYRSRFGAHVIQGEHA